MFGLISDRIYILFEIIVPYMYCKTNGNIVIHVRIVSPCKYRDMYRYGKHCIVPALLIKDNIRGVFFVHQ